MQFSFYNRCKFNANGSSGQFARGRALRLLRAFPEIIHIGGFSWRSLRSHTRNKPGKNFQSMEVICKMVINRIVAGHGSCCNDNNVALSYLPAVPGSARGGWLWQSGSGFTKSDASVCTRSCGRPHCSCVSLALPAMTYHSMHNKYAGLLVIDDQSFTNGLQIVKRHVLHYLEV